MAKEGEQDEGSKVTERTKEKESQEEKVTKREIKRRYDMEEDWTCNPT